MGSESPNQIPIIDLSKDVERGSKEWNDLSKRVKDACENYGCFEVCYDKIHNELIDQVFTIIKELFELPLETKEKYLNPEKPSMGYNTPSCMGSFENFGIGDSSNFDSLKTFSQLLLSDPIAQKKFCQRASSMVKHQNELHDTIWNQILDSFGVEEKPESTISRKSLLRMLKYKSPPPNGDNIGVFAHTDKALCAILCEHQCPGLEIQIKETGEWVLWTPNPNSYIFIVGDALVAWTNGRLHAAKHQVIMRENKDRYSIGAFVFPDDGTVIKPLKHFIDENHPQKFKEFDYVEFFNFCYTSSAPSDQKLNAFAGI